MTTIPLINRIDSLSLIIIADWYDELVIQSEKYYDDNTRSTWYPIMGGANIPSINRLLTHFGAKLGLQTFDGKFNLDGSEVSKEVA